VEEKMKKKYPYNNMEKLQLSGGAGFCWEFSSEENENKPEKEYGKFLADVYDYKLELYEPYIKDKL